MPFGKTVSKSKRGVIYPAGKTKCPVRTKMGDPSKIREMGEYDWGSPSKPTIMFTYNGGDPTKLTSYSAKDGYTLLDFVSACRSPEVIQEILDSKIDDIEDIVYLLEDYAISSSSLDDYTIFVGFGESGNDMVRYKYWRDGEVYRVAEIDDPSSDSARNICVPDESSIPGKVLKKDKKLYYSRSDAEYAAARIGDRYATQKDWIFDVQVNPDYRRIGYDDAVRLGYDGSDLEIDQKMNLGPFTITRVSILPKELFSDSSTKGRGSNPLIGSSNRGRAKARPSAPPRSKKTSATKPSNNCKGRSAGSKGKASTASNSRKTTRR